MKQDSAIEATTQASQKWQKYFNEGDAKGCASCYEETATMTAEPFGTFVGRDQIESFWNNIISQGFSEIEYFETSMERLDEAQVVLSSDWRMNKAHGVITKELWVRQDDGSFLLREDCFEVLSS